jgi:hypothetical protein
VPSIAGFKVLRPLLVPAQIVSTASAGLALSVVTSSLCPDCGHAWAVHPGALISITNCAECIVEEGHDAREVEDMCSRVPPHLEHVPVGDSLRVRYKRRLLRGDRVLIEDYAGGRWALLRPPVAGRAHVESLVGQVQEDLATMPITGFREKYRPLMD